VEHDTILDAAADAVFALKTGEVTEPVKSAFGWHIFHVTAITPPSVTPFEEMRPALEKEVAQQVADEALTKYTNKLEDALAGGSSLQEVAKEFGLKLTTIGPVNRQGETSDGKAIKDMPELDKFLENSFKTDEKAESSVTPSKNGMFYVVRVESITPERTRPLDDVRNTVIASWQKMERNKHLLELARDIAQKLAAGSTREATINKYNPQGSSSGAIKRTSRTAGDLAPPAELVADIFDHNPGQSTGIYPLKNGNYIIAIVKNIVPVVLSEGDAKMRLKLTDVRNNLESTTQNELIQQYLHYLSKKYPITINQSVLQAVSE
jgi:peptidyl-prolyl cis-trans isomerase D